MTMMEEETPEEMEDGEGHVGDLSGYVPIGEDRRIKEVYRD